MFWALGGKKNGAIAMLWTLRAKLQALRAKQFALHWGLRALRSELSGPVTR